MAGGRHEPPRTVGEMVLRGRAFLERKGVESARLEAELLVACALGMERLELFLQLDRPVAAEEIGRARDHLVRRASGEPCAYITGTREFYGRPFAVGPAVLIPRPETELLVDLARERLAPGEPRGGPSAAAGGPDGGLRVADVGTGSGCLAITLALELAGSRVTACDVSEPALELARRNARDLGARVDFVLGDGLAALERARIGELDLLVCNPPYVDPAEASALQPEVRDHEPAQALFVPAGDPDCWLRRLLDEVPRRLRPGGLLLVELGLGQAERAAELARSRGLEPCLHPDLAGVPRALEVSV